MLPTLCISFEFIGNPHSESIKFPGPFGEKEDWLPFPVEPGIANIFIYHTFTVTNFILTVYL